VIENKPFSRRDDDQRLTAAYTRILQGDEKTYFEHQQQIALKIFPTFKKEFQAEYPNSVPITARFQIFSDQLYFFFYSEERYIFTEFVKRFREKLGTNMFLFQIGARDMMRMSPGADGMYGTCGHTLCCKSYMVLPNVEIEAVILQNLEGRDIEKLKGKC
jgi:cell fate regulator YaaT (PSP1 superfamily)